MTLPTGAVTLDGAGRKSLLTQKSAPTAVAKSTAVNDPIA
jgi:hypothetical protein